LAFARQQPLEPSAIDADKLITAMDGLLRRTLREDHEIKIVQRSGLWPTMVDPSQLESALLNLAINARDAMPEGGKLTIETTNAYVDDSYATLHDEVTPGHYTLISVSDTGCGMSRETMARAFEPFYSTKGVGKGTGLGLSMVYGFAKQSGGHVKLYSEVGHGTTIKLYLPRADVVAAESATVVGKECGGSETVLVTEDDDMVRSHVALMLRELGYTVIVSSNGPEALAIIDSGVPFDLLLTDVIMPGGMTGRALAEEATKRRPGLKVLYMSGYSENAIVHHGRVDAGVHLLRKPYRRSELALKVRQVLDMDTSTAARTL
jgi:CheY-like chemotaxis protein